ncbi:MAG TPA: PQQ-binding-like beta-propeller repeat protein [Pirellulales bacterium]|jgi:outer membrane protein assembly factor BamB|nr:PQQ-binding-like beta-propeller repeat protein [Pirellulales bacterium]
MPARLAGRCGGRVLFVAAIVSLFAAADWPQFRGRTGSSLAPGSAPPVDFDVASGKNIAWKSPLPGRGASSPILVGDCVIVTASSGANQDRLHVLAFDATSGKRLWERQFWATGRTLCHPTSSIAAPTPASDGQRIFAFYSSNDLACLDLDGNLLWYRGLTYDYPTAANDVGMASSPLVVGDNVIVQVECLGESFAAAIDAATGKTRWRVDRPKIMNWCSPTLLRSPKADKDVVLLQGPKGLVALDPADGRQLWSFDQEASGIPSVVGTDGVLYVPSKGITALKPVAGGGTLETLWSSNKLEPASSSPVVLGDSIYCLNRAGALTAGDTAGGEVRWRLRLKGQFWATPVAAGDHLYCANSEGAIFAVKLGGEGQIDGESSLGEPVYGSPAVVDGALYVRSDAHLWKIAR